MLRPLGLLGSLAITIALVTCRPTVAFAADGGPRPPRGTPEWIEQQIEALGDPDPAVRERATAALISAGPVARTYLMHARDEDTPERAQRARAVLGELPWHVVTDPPAVRELLRGYGRKSAEDRAGVVRNLAALPKHEGAQTLARLIVEDDATAVRWAIVASYEDSDVSARPSDGLARQLLATDPNNPAAMALAGLFLERWDFPRMIEIYRAAIALDLKRPPHERGALDFAFEKLLWLAFSKQENGTAAGVLRQWHEHRPGTRDTIYDTFNPLESLFGLHASVGPLPGMKDDVCRYFPVLARPTGLYAMSKLAQRKRHPRLAKLLSEIAFRAGAGSPDERLDTAEFLHQYQWFADAKRELNAAAASPRAPAARIMNAQLRLGLACAQLGEDAAAADYLERALKRLENEATIVTRVRGSRRMIGEEALDDLRAQAAFHAVRAARATGDDAAAVAAAERLAASGAYDADWACEAVPVLKQHGRVAAADALFRRAYGAARRWLDEKPDDGARMNNFAWLCAVCGESLDEALSVAQRVAAIEPRQSAWVDTLAEVLFQLGRFEEAVEVSRQAVALQPDDPLAKRQLAKFEAGLAAASARGIATRGATTATTSSSDEPRR